MLRSTQALALCLALAGISAVGDALAAHRSSAAKAEFKRHHPCPSTGQSRGACPGFIVDHVKPICAGGPDAALNIQWQSVADAKAKDRQERKECKR